MNQIKSKTISSLFWKLLERAGNQFVQLVVQIVMARLLSPDDFGTLSIILVFINIGNVFIQSGLNTALVQAKNTTEEDRSSVFWMSFAISLVLYFVIWFSAPAIEEFYSAKNLANPLRVLSTILLINSLNAVQVSIITRDLDFKRIFKSTIISVISSGTIGILMALTGFGIWALVFQQLSYQLVNSLVLYIQNRWRPHLVFSVKRAKHLVSFGWKLLASGLMETGYQSLADLIIGKLFSRASLGLVSQGKKYPYAVSNMLDGAIQSVMLSAVSRLQDDAVQVKSLVRRALKTSVFIILPSMTLFAMLAEPIVSVVLGEKWLGCVPFLRLYCIICSFRPIHTANLQALNGMGRSDIYFTLEVIKKVLSLGILLIAAYIIKDIYAIVWGYVISGLISTGINAFPNKKIIHYAYLEQIADILPTILATAISAIISQFVMHVVSQDISCIIITSCSFCIAYLLISYFAKIEEMRYLLKTLSEARKAKEKI